MEFFPEAAAVVGTADVVDGDLRWGLHGGLFEKPRSPAGLATIPGLAALGEHGDQYQPEKLPPAEYVAILTCLCRLRFPMPPLTGELLYCSRHDDWLECRVLGTLYLKCESCIYVRSDFGTDRGGAVRAARNHREGSRKQRQIKHVVYLGEETEEGVSWTLYTPKEHQ